MRRSKLEIQIDLLKALARYGPLKLTHIMYKANANCSVLKQHLMLLAQHKLVEIKNRPKKDVIYAVTEKGKIALTHFKEIDKALQITGESSEISKFLF